MHAFVNETGGPGSGVSFAYYDSGMVIMGVDPGSRVTGYGVIEKEGNRVCCLTYGVIRTGQEGALGFAGRLKDIHAGLREIVETYGPQVMVVEDVFYAVNVKSALRLGHARGVILLAAAESGLEVVEYSPLEVKKAVVGYGRAAKQQIQTMVRRLLNLKEEPQPHDAADALAIALCHAFDGAGVSRSRGRHSRRHWNRRP